LNEAAVSKPLKAVTLLPCGHARGSDNGMARRLPRLFVEG
jgi:hypothetical protein